MSRKGKLSFLVFSLFTLLFISAYLAFYYGIPLFFQKQLPEFFKVADVDIFALRKEIVLKQFVLVNPQTCPNEALFYFEKAYLKVIPEEVKIKSLHLEKGKFYFTSVERCGLPNLVKKLPKSELLIQWENFFISLQELLLYDFALNFEKVEFYITQENDKYLISEVKIKAKDDFGGYHTIKGEGYFNIKEGILYPNFWGKVESVYSQISKLVAKKWPNLTINKGELHFTGKFWLKNRDLGIEGYLSLLNLSGAEMFSLLLTNPDQKQMVFPLQIRHSLNEKFEALKGKIEAELKVQIQKQIKKRAVDLVKKFLQP